VSSPTPVALVVSHPDEHEARATLDLISQARRSLNEARTLPDIRRVMEAASVAADAAQRAAKLAEARHAAAQVVDAANEAANDAAAVRIEAQAKAGELLGAMADRGERASGRPSKVSAPSTLSDLGVSRDESSLWQQVAAVPEPVRGEYVEAASAVRREVSTAGLLKHAQARSSADRPAIAAAARKRMRSVYRGVIELPGYRPEALVSALEPTERRSLLRALDRLPAWIEDVTKELAIHRVSKEE
jgi:hypothetical protein